MRSRGTASSSRRRRFPPRRCSWSTGTRKAAPPRRRYSRATTARSMPARSRARRPLPDDPTDTQSDAGAIERLEAMCHAISPALSPDRVIARQACHRPVTRDGLPLIGPVPGARRRHRGDGSWPLGHPERAGDRRGGRGTDPRRRLPECGPHALRSRPAAAHAPQAPRRGTATVSRTLGRHGETRERR